MHAAYNRTFQRRRIVACCVVTCQQQVGNGSLLRRPLQRGCAAEGGAFLGDDLEPFRLYRDAEFSRSSSMTFCASSSCSNS